MTNNNYEKEIKWIGSYLGCNQQELWDEVNKILTKKDQEHKAELEMIRTEIVYIRDTLQVKAQVDGSANSDASNQILEGIKTVLDRVIDKILDSHINKLSTE